MTPSLCRDCLARDQAAAGGLGRCAACGSPRIVSHPELCSLAIAHVDCDAFYAAVEKRDDPRLADRPVIIGGGRRGVVATACYVARIRGVKSAMPMFKALARCPDAVVVKPRMEVYAAVSRRIRALFEALTPLVEPLSLDEAFLDLSGTERLHGAPPAAVLARLQARIEREVGVTVSVGLSWNKFLAKLASERDKPRGFAMIGRAETEDFLAALPVSAIWGVGATMRTALAAEGIDTIADLRRADPARLVARHGAAGARLHALAWGRDARAVSPDRTAKNLSAETTFEEDVDDPQALAAHLWRLTVKVSDRLKAKGLAGRVVTLKLKRRDFRLLTRRASLAAPTDLSDILFRAAAPLLDREAAHGPFRLIGLGAGDLGPGVAGLPGDLFDPAAATRATAERAADSIRARFGADAIAKGRGLLTADRKSRVSRLKTER
ncbi:MAG: DNA polymerase IV [Rhodobacteraceae bacterium]|nr:MAG: DNA polymerase IV [Paracoccaceae bacterium]